MDSPVAKYWAEKPWEELGRHVQFVCVTNVSECICNIIPCHRFMMLPRRTFFSCSNCRWSTLSRKFFLSTYLKTNTEKIITKSNKHLAGDIKKHPCVRGQRHTHTHWTLCKLGTIYPEAAFIVPGDFNKANLRTWLPKPYQHIDCSTRAGKTLDHCYSNLRDACIPPSLRQT